MDPDALTREERIDWKVKNGQSEEDAEEEERQMEEERMNEGKGAVAPVERDAREDMEIGTFFTQLCDNHIPFLLPF